jgi:C1A family cysteine protease
LNGDWPNRLARAAGFSDVTGNPAAIKQHIYTYGAVDACFIVYQDFYSYRSGVYRHVTGDVAGGHCVALIGWDDAQGCWIGKNSWGPGWGDGGFFKIAYGDSFIEDYPGSEPSVMGATGVLLRAWARGTRITGLWSDASERNAWAFARDMGWLKITAGSNVAQHSMLLELAAAKGANRPVNLFQDNGTITEDYVL